METTNLALLSFLAGTVFLAAVPTTDAASISYVVHAAADAADEDEIEDGDDDISVLRKRGSGGGGVGGGVVGGGNSNKECKSGKTRKTLTCKGDVTGKVRLIEGLNCPGLQYSEAAITVTNGATLDCQGNTIIGSGNGVGIKVEKGGTVTNCKVIGFGTGIYSSGPSTITNCVISDSFYGLDYFPNTSSPKDKHEAKNVYITNSVRSISMNLDGKTNKFKFDSVTIANRATSGEYYGIYVFGDMAGSSLTFNKITSAAPALFDEVKGSGATIKIKSSIFDGGGVTCFESGTTNDIKLSIEKTLIINAPGNGIFYNPGITTSSTLDVSDSSIVLSGDDGVGVAFGTATLDSVELSGNGEGGLNTFDGDSDVTAKNILVQFNGGSGIFTESSASVNVNDSKVCQNDVDIDGGPGSPPALNNVVCETDDFGSGVTCPSSPETCTDLGEVATTSCD